MLVRRRAGSLGSAKNQHALVTEGERGAIGRVDGDRLARVSIAGCDELGVDADGLERQRCAARIGLTLVEVVGTPVTTCWIALVEPVPVATPRNAIFRFTTTGAFVPMLIPLAADGTSLSSKPTLTMSLPKARSWLGWR